MQYRNFGRVTASFAIATALIASPPVAAQDAQQEGTAAEDTAQEAAPAAAPRTRPPRRQFLDLSVTVPREESDQLLADDCEEEADAARIAGEIIVCRQLGEASDGSWNKEEWERDYARRTQGGSTPDTFGIANHGNAIGFGSVPPPALIIDVEALPEAPEGSDADRIARGLAPTGQDEDLSPEQIAARRRAAGLDAPPIPSRAE
jgi:hypothetical protein